MEIKKCPFCGGEAELIEDLYVDPPDIIGGGRNPDFDSFCVRCKNCPTYPFERDSKKEAIKAWNRRQDDN